MNRIRNSVLGRFLSWLALLAFLVLQVPTAALAASGTKVTHDAIQYFVPGQRIRLDATVVDPKGVTLVRAYFKGQGQAEYIFVPMTAQQTKPDSYVATLPALAKSNDLLEYRFLVVNGDNAVVKTDALVVKKKDSDEIPSWQMVKDDGPMKLFTELSDAPSVATSFSDSVSVDVIESGARFGLVAEIYSASSSTAAVGTTAGSTSGSAATGATASASNAGTISISASGLSTTAVVVAAAAGVAGIGAAAGGGGSSSTPTQTTSSFIPCQGQTPCVLGGDVTLSDSSAASFVLGGVSMTISGNTITGTIATSSSTSKSLGSTASGTITGTLGTATPTSVPVQFQVQVSGNSGGKSQATYSQTCTFSGSIAALTSPVISTCTTSAPTGSHTGGSANGNCSGTFVPTISLMNLEQGVSGC